jgi:O-methyltransferase involved in polyketide biosynthesis
MLVPLGLKRESEAISPTAHYTGHVWTRNALSHPALRTLEGRALFAALEPAMKLNEALGGTTLEGQLLARHRALDCLLERAIEEGGITQVIEVACGMSPRGWRFGERYGDRLTYVEADLPAMAARKRRALERIGSLSDTHRVVELDAMAAEGPASLAEIAAPLDRGRGLAIVTEGLLGYFPLPQVLDVWRRFADLLGEFAANRYLSDLLVATDTGGTRVRVFRVVLSAFVRGRVYVHFADASDAESALLEAGFSSASVLQAAACQVPPAEGDGELVRVADAVVQPQPRA